MIENLFVCGGGGGGLLATVVGGDTKPANPTAGTIWIPTTVEIGKVTMDVTAPVSPAVGDVFVGLGVTSRAPIFVDENDTVTIYPLSVKQWNGTEWVIFVGEVFDGSDWKNLLTYLYKNGDQCVAETGGWSNAGYCGMSNVALSPPTFNADKISVTINSGVYVGAGTANAITLTEYSTIIVKITARATSNNYLWAAVLNPQGVNPQIRTAGVVYLNQPLAAGDHTWTIDVSALTGNYYFSVGGYQSDFDVNEVFLF